MTCTCDEGVTSKSALPYSHFPASFFVEIRRNIYRCFHIIQHRRSSGVFLIYTSCIIENGLAQYCQSICHRRIMKLRHKVSFTGILLVKEALLHLGCPHTHTQNQHNLQSVRTYNPKGFLASVSMCSGFFGPGLILNLQFSWPCC